MPDIRPTREDWLERGQECVPLEDLINAKSYDFRESSALLDVYFDVSRCDDGTRIMKVRTAMSRIAIDTTGCTGNTSKGFEEVKRVVACPENPDDRCDNCIANLDSELYDRKIVPVIRTEPKQYDRLGITL